MTESKPQIDWRTDPSLTDEQKWAKLREIRDTQLDRVNHTVICPKCGFKNKSFTPNPNIYTSLSMEELNAQGAAVVTEYSCQKCHSVLNPKWRKINWNKTKRQ